jgi:cob(I)alamin adenosyltransferase
MLNDQFEFSQPVPWDEKCFLNKTTSLCGKEPVKDFRFCIQGDGSFPIAVFLGSDGLDDSYGDDDKLNSFYGSIVKELASKGQEDVVNMLKEDLPKISKMGSQDDMSVAVVYDETKIAEAAFSINEYQKSLVKKEIIELQEKTEKKKVLIQRTRELESSVEKMKAEARMAEKEMAREQAQIERLQERLDKLESFTLHNIIPYEEES